jgi:hypothetical protein
MSHIAALPQTIFTTETRRKTRSKAKPEPTEAAEATEL